jgi:tetratricopeptide (TPR) repeat protein
MRHNCETPKPREKKVKSMPSAGPKLLTGLPRASSERAHKVIGKLAKQGNFQSIDDLNAHLRKLMDSGELNQMIDAAPESPAEQAQDLAYRAMEEPSSAKARKLAEKALKLDPDCIDAMMIHAQTRRLSSEKYIAEVRAAVKAGERGLGEERFRKDRGHFWGFVETRPYMRARRELAMALIAEDKLREAAAEFEGILELNPNDNQGVRDYLLGVYLALSDVDGAARLFRQYAEDGSAVFAWGQVFLLMLSGRRAEARKALEAAFRNNPWPAKIFFGGQPPEDPLSYGLGDEDEGQHAAVALLPAVAEHPDVLVWIAKESIGVMKGLMEPDSPRRPRRVH